jgi:hypothetical protein
MRVNVDDEAVLFALAEHAYGVLEILLIVLASEGRRRRGRGGLERFSVMARRTTAPMNDSRSTMLDALPRRHVSQAVESPAPQPPEMRIRRVRVVLIEVQVEDAVNEADIARLAAFPEPSELL